MIINYRVNAGFLPLDHWTQDPSLGGGRIIGEGCHFIDFLTFLVGQNPVSVSSDGLADNGRYNQDNVVMTLKYPDGSIGTISYLANGDKAYPKEHVEVFCGGRVAVLNDFRSLEMASKGKLVRKKTTFKQDKGHQACWAAFLEALRNHGQAPIPYDQLVMTTQASFTTLKPCREGGTHPSLSKVNNKQETNYMSESRFFHISNKGALDTVSSLADAMAASKNGGYIWLDFTQPKKEDLFPLISFLKFHPLSIEDCTDESQLPKIDMYENYTFLIFNAYEFTPEALLVSEDRYLYRFEFPGLR